MSTAIAKRDEQHKKIRAFLTDKKQLEKLADALPPGVSAETLVRVFLNSLADNPALLEASIGNQASLWSALVESATLGLIIGGPMPQGYLVPYAGKVNFQMSYHGIIALVQRTGKLRKIVAVDVRQGEVFEESEDPLDDIPLKHVKNKASDRHKLPITHVWAGASLDDGTRVYWSMSKEEIDDHKQRYSQGWDRKGSAWKDHWEAMAKKTVLLELIRQHHLPIALDDQRREKYIPEPQESARLDVGDRRLGSGIQDDGEITADEEWKMFQNYAADRMSLAVGILDVDKIAESLNSEYQGDAHAKYIFEIAESRRNAIRGSRGENSTNAGMAPG